MLFDILSLSLRIHTYIHFLSSNNSSVCTLICFDVVLWICLPSWCISLFFPTLSTYRILYLPLHLLRLISIPLDLDLTTHVHSVNA